MKRLTIILLVAAGAHAPLDAAQATLGNLCKCLIAALATGIGSVVALDAGFVPPMDGT